MTGLAKNCRVVNCGDVFLPFSVDSLRFFFKHVDLCSC